MVSLAKWLNVRLRTKWLWVRIPLLSPKLQIWCLVRAVLSAICAFIFDLFPFLYTLRNSTLKHMSLFCACLTCVFYLMSFLVAPRQPHFQWHFYFFLKKKKDEQILRLHLIMENNVGSSYVHRMCYEIAKILSANDCFFFSFSR